MNNPTVGVVGGGLAGLAAATALAKQGLRVTLLESRSRLGGRAGSFHDAVTGQSVDYCQHVSMGCCINLADLCHRLEIDDCFERHTQFHFWGPQGNAYPFSASRWLPAPLHLAPSLLRLAFLRRGERLQIARALGSLARWQPHAAEPSMRQWLQTQRQSQRAIDLFWSAVVTSALGDTVDRVGVVAARKVFVDGFMASRQGYELLIPSSPLAEIFDARIAPKLQRLGMDVRHATPARRITGCGDRVGTIELADRSQLRFDHVVVAVPWYQCAELFAAELKSQLPQLDLLSQLQPAPITGVHLWFDRPISAVPHAVLVGRLSQWLFNRGLVHLPQQDQSTRVGPESPGEAHSYQVVISASYEALALGRQKVIDQVVEELRQIWPAACSAKLLHAQVVNDRRAVFSCSPECDRLRPGQETDVANLALAGDWTNTGWPATMEGAVRSGYLAAEVVLRRVGRPEQIVRNQEPTSWWTKMLLRTPTRSAPSLPQ